MEIYQLKSFIAVAKEGNITRAAESLYTSQPSVSTHIKSLEEEIGILLFERTSKGMKLTSRGRQLKDYATKALHSINHFIEQARQIRHHVQASIKLGYSTDPKNLKVDQLINQTNLKHPEVDFQVFQQDARQIITMIKNEQLDCGFVLGKKNSSEIEYHKLSLIQLSIVGPKEWHNKIQGKSFIELAGLPWVFPNKPSPLYHVLTMLFSKHQVKPQKITVADQEIAKRNLVQSGLGLSLLPVFDNQKTKIDHCFSVWSGIDIEIALSLVYLKRKKLDSAIQFVISKLNDIWKSTNHSSYPFTTTAIFPDDKL